MNAKFVFACAALVSLMSGCGGTETTATIAATTADLSVVPLLSSSSTPMTPRLLRGTYGPNCKLNANKTWDLRVNDFTDKSLEVAIGDTVEKCPLVITGVQMQYRILLNSELITFADYTLNPPVALNTAFAKGASGAQGADHRNAFYANGRLFGLGVINTGTQTVYNSDFGIQLIYSTDSIVGATAPAAAYQQVGAVALGSSVPPPGYKMSFDTLMLMVNANNAVRTDTSSGSVVLGLGDGDQSGEELKIFSGSGPCCGNFSFEQIDLMYHSMPIGDPLTIRERTPLALDWTRFSLQSLPAWRTVIVRHTDGGAVYSYQLFEVLFPGPQPMP